MTAVLPPNAVDLAWIPLGSGPGSGLVRWSGRTFESHSARREHRQTAPLFHSALVVRVDGVSHAVEMAPAWSHGREARGVVAEGAVGLHLLGRSRYFRYEVRRWAGGSVPDLDDAVGGLRPLSRDREHAERILQLVPSFPRLTWGRDELHTGDMWNSNSLTAWLLSSSGHETAELAPPDSGRAPGWTAGVTAAALMHSERAGAGRG